MTPRLLICALLLLYLPALASAQQTQLELPGVDGYELAPMSAMYDPTQGTIRLDVEVKDKSGYPVTGLRQQDFTLQDNGRPGTIVTFQAFDGPRERADPPVAVIVVIDELNMQDGPQLQAAEDEAETFLRQNQGHLAQPVSIYRITRDGPWAGSYSSTDGNALAEEIVHQSEPHVSWKKPNGPSTARKPINSNLAASLDLLGSIAIEERRRPGRKLLFWLGPGWQIDRPIEGELVQRSIELGIRMREARIAIWEATEWPSSNDQGKPLPTHDIVDPTYTEDTESGTSDLRPPTLPLLATQSGGGVLEATNNLFTWVAMRIEEGSCFYSLTFDPPRTVQVDEYHRVKVEVGQSDTTVRTRAGYFDEPVFYDQPNPGIVPTTVEQLENAVRAARGAPDRELAQQLSLMELTERLNSIRLRALESALPGKKKARQALIALADESVFLAPPAAEILPTAAPDADTQQQMISRAIAYVAQTIPRLPNFLAQRITVEYGEAPRKPGTAWKTVTGDTSLYVQTTTKATLRFQDGKEVVEEEAAASTPRGPDTLTTHGVFGPILGPVVVGALRTHGDLSWSRWEMGAQGPEAVFRYGTTREKDLYFTSSDYLTIRDSVARRKGYEPFHGEFAIDPASGAVLRLTLEADFEPRLALDRSDIMVEYGPQVLGGRTYICPARSVSISRHRVIMDMHEFGASYKIYAPFETLLNDMVFDKYHLFQPTVRMLPGFRPAPQGR